MLWLWRSCFCVSFFSGSRVRVVLCVVLVLALCSLRSRGTLAFLFCARISVFCVETPDPSLMSHV